MPKYTVEYDRAELGWVVFEDGDAITPGFDSEDAADAWMVNYIARQEQEIELVLLGNE